MKVSNSSNIITEFILLGFPCTKEGQILLFLLFLIIYILTLMGNGSIVCAVRWDQRLHTPMYILLANFSFLEIWYVTSTVPNMLANFLSDTKVISFSGCFLQFYFFFSLGSTECFFLAIMAFDRYLAICRPLHYPTIMTRRLCTNLVIGCWVLGFLWFLVPIIFISQMSFCGSRIIDHFLCDPGPLLGLTCTKAPIIEMTSSTLSSLLLFIPFLFIMGSYALVLQAVLRVPSAAGRKKAFSTCGSHLAVVSLFYGSVMVMYVSPTSEHDAGMQKTVTLFYSVVTPLINPVIYSLRNKDMKHAMKKLLGKPFSVTVAPDLYPWSPSWTKLKATEQRQAKSQAPMTFADVVVHFTHEEWHQMDPWQRYQQEPILNFYLSSMVEEEPSDKKSMQKQDLLQWLIVKRSNRNSLGTSKQKNSAHLKTEPDKKDSVQIVLTLKIFSIGNRYRNMESGQNLDPISALFRQHMFPQGNKSTNM
ncbi:olfactory receptor 11G2-like [Suncus etruscus]|uniref:olfactory receptor 11G2-like n=1 Tax=Suncus etruscus TaxID=109475 RepID=UPI00210FB25A|nr:olfactory receptor 11G2-like [Suncus etruscus]